MSVRETAGTLELLWCFTMEHAPSGDIGKWPDQDIEEACDWHGEPGALVKALVSCGWLDACDEHRLLVHDWADHIPEFLRLRIKRGGLVLARLSGRCLVGDQTPSGQRPTAVDREGKGREVKGRVVTPPDRRPVEDRSRAESEPEGNPWPLLNAIATYDGEEDEKRAWLEHEYPLIKAEADAGGNPKRIVSIAIRFYRNYLKGDRIFKNWAAKQETARRLAEHEARCLEAMHEIEAEEGYEAAHR